MKRKTAPIIMLVLLACFLILSGCNKSKKYVVFAESTVLTDSSRSLLEKRLSDKNIDFIVNKTGDVLVKEVDLNKATICCS